MGDQSTEGGLLSDDRDAARLVAEAKGLFEERRFNRAAECMDAAIRLKPDHLECLRFRGLILTTINRFEGARSDFERLVELAPSDAAGWLDLGHCCRAMGQHDDAEHAFLRTLDLSPESVQSMVSLGALYREAGSYQPAIRWLQKAVSVSPTEVRAHCVLGTTLLAAGQAQSGRKSLETAFSLNPYDRTTMAYLYVAFCHTGDIAAAIALVKPDQLVRSYQHDSTPSESLNERLADHVRRHPTLEFQRAGNTTRGGSQTGNLLEDSPGPVAELCRWIDDRVRQYLEEIPKSESHPYLAWSPKRWDMDIWAVVMQSGGFQQPHIHTDGWLSGVYYVAVPEEVISGDDPRGCLELGRPPAPFCDSGEFPTRTLRPGPGRLNIFPSFLWHRTLPYESKEERICIAFDVKPRL
jgi:tetratricopeptide (TPR) repeat protein